MGKARRAVRGALRAALVLALLAGFAVEFWGGRYGIPTWGALQRMLGFAAGPEAALPDGAEAAVTVFDVGQGDAVLIAQGGEYALIDAGTPESAEGLCAALRGAGVARLKLLVLTHPHADHSGGMTEILKNFNVDTLILPPVFGEEPWAMQLVRTRAGKEGVPVATAEAGQSWPVGEGTLSVLQAGFADPDPDATANTVGNNASLCLRYTAGDFAFLDTGDAEAAAEQALVDGYGSNLCAVLFKAGHHGSSTSNTAALLDAVRPRAAAISCGKDNDYGHPHAAVLRRFADYGIDTARTDELGTLTWLWQDGTLTLHTAQDTAGADAAA